MILLFKYLRHFEDGQTLIDEMLVDREAGIKFIIEVGLPALQELDLLQHLLMHSDVLHVVALLCHLLLRFLLDYLCIGRVL